MHPNIYEAERYNREIEFGEGKEYTSHSTDWPFNLNSKAVGAGEAEPTSTQEKLGVS